MRLLKFIFLRFIVESVVVVLEVSKMVWYAVINAVNRYLFYQLRRFTWLRSIDDRYPVFAAVLPA